MISRPIATLVIAFAIVGTVFADEPSTKVRVGDQVLVDMTGSLAKEYARRSGFAGEKISDSESIMVSTPGLVSRRLFNGYVCVDISTPVMRNGVFDRLLTLSATVDSNAIITKVTPAQTVVFSSPAEQKAGGKGVVVQKDTQMLHLELSDLKGVKLRTWTLEDEIGE